MQLCSASVCMYDNMSQSKRTPPRPRRTPRPPKTPGSSELVEDDEEDMLRSLLRMVERLREWEQTQGSAGALENTVTTFQPELDDLAAKLEEVRHWYAAIPGSELDPSPGRRRPGNSGISLQIDKSWKANSNIVDLRDDQRHTDVTFLVNGNQKVSAHRLILASQSEYFDRLLFGKMMEAQNRKDSITLPETPVRAFYMLLEFAYSGYLEVKNEPLEDILDLIKIADRFGFVTLKDEMGKQLSKWISTDNILPVVICADLLHISDLKDKCHSFLNEHAEEVVQSEAFSSLPANQLCVLISEDSFRASELSIIKAITKWNSHAKHSEDEVKNVLSCVRLPQVSIKELTTTVESTGLFDPQTLLCAIQVQTKPILEKMRPRGIPETKMNYFEKVKVLSKQNMVVSLPQKQNVFRAFGAPGPCPVPGISQCELDLGNTYLVNCLTFKIVPQAYLDDSMCYSYTLRFSINSEDWITLADYSKYSCYKKQSFCFPVQAMRYVQLSVNKSHLGVELVCCLYKERLQPSITIKSAGVIASLKRFAPVCNQLWTSDMESEYLVGFSQPYYINKLQFKIAVPGSTYQQKVSVFVGTKLRNEGAGTNSIHNRQLVFMETKSLENSTTITCTVQEQVVSYVLIQVSATNTQTSPAQAPQALHHHQNLFGGRQAPTVLAQAPQVFGGRQAPTVLAQAPQVFGGRQAPTVLAQAPQGFGRRQAPTVLAQAPQVLQFSQAPQALQLSQALGQAPQALQLGGSGLAAQGLIPSSQAFQQATHCAFQLPSKTCKFTIADMVCVYCV